MAPTYLLSEKIIAKINMSKDKWKPRITLLRMDKRIKGREEVWISGIKWKYGESDEVICRFSLNRDWELGTK